MEIKWMPVYGFSRIVPPKNKPVVLYNQGAFWLGFHDGKKFVSGFMDYPTYWADIIPESATAKEGWDKIKHLLTEETEPDGWTKDWFAKRKNENV